MSEDSAKIQTKAESQVTVDLTMKLDSAPNSTVRSQSENIEQSTSNLTFTVHTPKPGLENQQRQSVVSSVSSVSGRQIRQSKRLGGSANERREEVAENPGSEGSSSRKTPSKRKTLQRSDKKEEPEKTLQEVKEKCDQLTITFSQMKKEKITLEQEFLGIKQARTDLNKELKQEKGRNTAYQKDLKQKSEHIKKLEGLLRDEKLEHEEKFAEEQQRFFKAQEAVSDLMKQGVMHAISDDVVRTELRKVKSMWRPWAKEWAIHSANGLDSATMRMLLNHGSASKTPAATKGLCEMMRNIASAPSILLNMMLAQLVCRKLFQHPFFVFTERTSNGSSIRAAFEAILREMKHAQVAKASAWRANTLQMLSPFVDVGPTTAEADLQWRRLKKLNHDYGNLATSFEKILAPLLKNVTVNEAVKRHDELVGICKEAGNLAYKLWSQKTHMQLVAVFGNDKPFHIRSGLMQPHASMLCDHDSHEYDGRVVQLCVEPAIIAFGNAQGEDYHQYKIWMPATVWIAGGISAKPSSASPTTDNFAHTVEIQIKGEADSKETDFEEADSKEGDSEEADSGEDTLGARPAKKARLTQAVPPAEAAKVGTSSNLKPKSMGQRSASLKADGNSMPPSSMRNSDVTERSAVKSSTNDAASFTNAFKLMIEPLKNKSGPASLQEQESPKYSKRNTSGPSATSEIQTEKNLRDYMAEEAGSYKMSEFNKILAQASSNETTYERALMATGPSAAQPRPRNKPVHIEEHQEQEQAKGIDDARNCPIHLKVTLTLTVF